MLLIRCELSIGAVLWLCACSGGTTFAQTTGTGSRGHEVTASASSGAASTGSGTTGSGSSTGGSSGITGGTTGGTDCGTDWLENWYDGGNLRQPGECSDSQVELKGRVTSIEAFGNRATTPPAFTTPFTAADAFMPGIVASTDACGAFWFCVDPGTSLTPSFNIDGYPPSELATYDMRADSQPEELGADNGVLLAADSVFQFINSDNPQPAIDPTLPVITIGLQYLNAPALSACSVLSGWTFTLLEPDGGVVAASSMFLSGTSFSQLDAGTSEEGIEVFYDLPSDLSYVTVQADRLGGDLPDGGPTCPCLSTTVGEFSGQIPLVKAGLTIFYYLVD